LLPVLLAGCSLLLVLPVTVAAADTTSDRAKQFIKNHDARIRPLEIANNRAWWTASISGKDEDFQKKEEAQNKLDKALADRDVFAELKALHEKRKEIEDPVTRRAIDMLYLQYLEKQLDVDLMEKMTKKANEIEKRFNNFRAVVDGKKMTDNKVR